MRKRRDMGGARRLYISGDLPCPTVMAGGVGSVNTSQYEIEMKPSTHTENKPPYQVPSMEEIRALPWNGFTAASTFSGCGGSSLGYRMAGFRVLYANEFIPAAQDSYRANAADYTHLDTRDIRQVQPQDILTACGLSVGELDLFDGSPPCASFSTAGKRESGWGKVKKYSDSEQRTDDLFFEYSRLIRGIQPRVFVAENVSGLVKGTAKGYFLEILKELKGCGYKVGCKVLDAQWLGVPQARQRTIFVGVREDLKAEPTHPKPLPYRYSVRDALPWIQKIQSGSFCAEWMSSDNTIGTIVQSDGTRGHRSQVEAETDISRYAIGAEWEKLKPGEGSSKYLNLKRTRLDGAAHCISADGGNLSTAGVCHPTEKRKFSITELKRICGFPDDFILTGTYAQQWERCGRSVPPVMMSHIAATIRDEILKKVCVE
jgi:DNA (cytosine-5)-methyltransferase 1